MDSQQSRHTKVNKSYRFPFLVCAIIFLTIGAESCKYWNGTYYFYLTSPPHITGDDNEAVQHHYFTKKVLNDSTYYYYADGKHSVTKDSIIAQYTTRIGTFKQGKPVRFIWLDGYGDTMRVDCFESNWNRKSMVTYYGEKRIELKWEYNNGKLHGVAQRFYPNGVLQEVSLWENGKSYGEYLNYHSNGQLRIQGLYSDGKPDGTFLYFSEQGDTLKTERWEKGRFIDSVSYQNR